MKRTVILMATATVLLLLAVSASARSWSAPTETKQWSAPTETRRWSEQETTKQWSEPAKSEKWSEPATVGAGDGTRAGNSRALAAGDKAQVSWAGGWYDATVLEIGDGTYQVRYDGWGSDWDEWVTPARLRTRDGAPVAAAAAPAAPPAPRPAPSAAPAPPQPAQAASSPPPAKKPEIWSTSPVGRWGCRTWDYGQVNRVGEFRLKANGTYDDLMYGGSGRYRYDAKSGITFTSGPQKTAYPISFNPEGHQGKGHLIFDYGGGARLDCYREAIE